MLAGDPGLGKSLVTLDIAARVSRGAPWPDARHDPQPVGGVVLLSGEDDVADTIRPRLDAHNADVSRVIALQGISGSDTAGDYKRPVDLARDLDHLRSAIKEVHNCRLLIVDPISAYMGKSDSHVNAEVRAVLAPFAELAAEMHIAILCVSHLRKGEGQALHRTMGSLAFVAAARAAWVVCKDNSDPERRLLLSVKNNLAADVGSGLAYRIESHGPSGAPVVCWSAEPVNISADEAMAPEHKGNVGRRPLSATKRRMAPEGIGRRSAGGKRTLSTTGTSIDSAYAQSNAHSRRSMADAKRTGSTAAGPGRFPKVPRRRQANPSTKNLAPWEKLGTFERIPGKMIPANTPQTKKTPKMPSYYYRRCSPGSTANLPRRVDCALVG